MVLADIADVLTGQAIRGAITNDPEGIASVVQMRDVDLLSGVNWSTCIRHDLRSARNPKWLRPGDILFLARGQSNHAYHLSEVPDDAVCAPQFHIIRVTDSSWTPAALAVFMNYGPAQAWFSRYATGSGNQRNIKLGTLERLPICELAPDIQELLALIGNDIQLESELMRLLTEVRRSELSELVHQAARKQGLEFDEG